MKVFLIGWSYDIQIKAAEMLRDKYGIDIPYWTCRFPDKVDRKKFKHAIVHLTRDAIRGLPSREINYSEFEPVGSDLVKALYECESTVLTMMNRIHKFQHISVNRRKRIYYRYLKYWHGVIKKFKPDAVIFGTFPHMTYDFVIYSLAKFFNIPALMFDVTRIPDQIMIVDDIKKGSTALRQEIEKNNSGAKLENLKKELRDYYELMVSEKETFYPFVPPETQGNMDDNSVKKIPKLKSLFNSFLDGNFTYKAEKYFRKINESKINDYIQAEYKSLQVKPDLNKKFIFAPFHYQPENSSCPLGGIFTDQLLMVDILAKSVPKDWLIYVKEHVVQWIRTEGTLERHSGYYKELLKCGDNVRLIPVDTEAKELISNSQAVATLTGTAGWEGLFRGKPALIFGYPVYMHCDGAFRIDNYSDCQEAINKIRGGYKPDQQKVISYLAALDKLAFRGRLGVGNERIKYISDEECSANLADAVDKHLLRVTHNA